MSDAQPNPADAADPPGQPVGLSAVGDLAALSAVEIVGHHAYGLLTAAAVKLGLFEGGDEHLDLADARILVSTVAGLVDAAAPELGHHHAAPLRDAVGALQKEFRARSREVSGFEDAPGAGPGERYTGPVVG